jgi:transposase
VVSRRALRWALEGIVCQHLTVARVSEGLGVEHRERRGAIRDGTGPARLLDMAEDRPEQVFKTWPGERDKSWRDGAEVAAMDGFTGFKTATSEELPDAVAVMDPFHVVRLAGDALDQCRRPRPAGHPRAPRPQRRPALCRAADVAAVCYGPGLRVRRS